MVPTGARTTSPEPQPGQYMTSALLVHSSRMEKELLVVAVGSVLPSSSSSSPVGVASRASWTALLRSCRLNSCLACAAARGRGRGIQVCRKRKGDGLRPGFRVHHRTHDSAAARTVAVGGSTERTKEKPQQAAPALPERARPPRPQACLASRVRASGQLLGPARGTESNTAILKPRICCTESLRSACLLEVHSATGAAWLHAAPAQPATHVVRGVVRRRQAGLQVALPQLQLLAVVRGLQGRPVGGVVRGPKGWKGARTTCTSG